MKYFSFIALPCVLFVLVPFALAAPRATTRPASRAVKIDRSKSPAVAWARTEAANVLAQLETSQDYTAAGARLSALFDALVLNGDDESLAALPEFAKPLRLVTQLSACEEPLRKKLLPFLRQHPAVAGALAITMSPDDDVQAAYQILSDLRAKNETTLDEQANLVAALCTVRDQPLEIVVAENPQKVAEPVAVFDYFVKAEKQLFFGLREVSPALLAYLVDTTTPVPEMAWALGKYRGSRQVGQRFFEIRYDDQAFVTGQQVKSRVAGYTLPGILQNGGVCADQAYFAQAVGKSIGVPATYCRGRSGEVGHAWVGFLERQPKGVRWNFDAGRYEDYRGQKGLVVDPQSRKDVPDAYVSLTAELAGTSVEQREESVAFTDAALRLESSATTTPSAGVTRSSAAAKESGSGATALSPSASSATASSAASSSVSAPSVSAPSADVTTSIVDEMKAAKITLRETPRSRGLGDQLELLQRAIDACPGDLRPWLEVARLAESGKLTAAQKSAWTDKVLAMYGNRYPDLTLTLLSPMIRSVADPREQDKLWSSVFRMFPNRADLLADVRLQQAALWVEAKQNAKASEYYLDVINRFAASGPAAVDALRGVEKLLTENGQRAKIIDVYARAWPKMQRSSTGARQFARQSNWYIVGEMYMDRLRLNGKDREAESVRVQLQNAVRFDAND